MDISEAAINKAKNRLDERSELVKWVVCDITGFKTDRHFDLWLDRAAFHFLTEESQITAYLKIAGDAINRYMVIGTFSENGPEKCSGLPIKQYTENQLNSQLQKGFKKIRCIHEDHITPFQTKQNFLFCSFKKQASTNALNHRYQRIVIWIL
ncbi:hypothetical protein GGR35_003831 [Mucilaginibacter phyllosphaerae]|uniref:Class I SAM-dependent methyltransferase n=1 Tax=Mucilaginibacter phyllosphaerae TaxID=1812349 RepID=A0ABR6IDR8_9SPHI|nr:hypothetical protein [Mucilaginibacter phyllosphaerae]